MTKFRLANPCQNKESKERGGGRERKKKGGRSLSRRNMTKETNEMLMNVFSTH